MTKEEQYKHEFYNSFTVGDLSDEGKANLTKLLELKDSKKQMNRYNAQILNDKGEYHLQFETNSRENFNAMEKLAQKCIDNKPRTNFDKITESAESLALTISNCVTSCEDCPAYENVCEGTSKSCPAKIRKWLQKECENG